MYGKVVFRILFDAEGKYVRHIVLKDPYSLLTEIYLSQIKILEASPALDSEGQPAAAWLIVPFQVHLIR